MVFDFPSSIGKLFNLFIGKIELILPYVAPIILQIFFDTLLIIGHGKFACIATDSRFVSKF